MARILGWNVNGLRSLKTNMKDFLDDLNADVICFQETKITRDMLTEELAIVDGYHSFFNFSQKRSGYSGVATYCKKTATPISASVSLSKLDLGISGHIHEPSSLVWTSDCLKNLDTEGRALITLHLLKNNSAEEIKLCIFNVYCPRADPERPDRATYKMDFYSLLREQGAALRNLGYHIIIIGDINTFHQKIDHCDPYYSEEFEKREDRQFLDSFFCSQEELDAEHGSYSINDDGDTSHANKSIVEDDQITSEHDDESLNLCGTSNKIFKVVDSFRHFHPSQTEAFTCWNTKANARATNYGTRIDYVLCDKHFLGYISDSCIHPTVMGSDHCPISIFLKEDISFVPSGSIPASCTKYFPEFQGHQQKLSSYFGPTTQLTGCTDEATLELLKDNTKRKLCDVEKSDKKSQPQHKKQQKLSSYFMKLSKTSPENSPKKNTRANADVSPEKPDCESRLSPPLRDEGSCNDRGEGKRSLKEAKSGWGFLMKGPKPPPLCPGHKEASVLKTVKKKGPNFNRQFYACSKGAGREGDPNAQCNFFKWFS